MTTDKIRILYIDDYELDRELVKDALEKEHGGFEVTEVSNKQEFETLLKNCEFDVVLSDFNIAGFDGLQVLEAVQAHDPSLPVIIVTGTGSEEIAVMALKQGASDYVIKRPKHIRRLPQTIFAAIEKQTLRDQSRKTENSLKESEEKYRKIFENIFVGIYQVAIDGKFIFANKKMVEMFGYSSYKELEAIGGITELYARPEERQKKIDEIIKKGFIIDEIEFMRKDGKSIWCRINSRKTTNKKGLIVLEGLLEDVTEIRNMRIQLQQAQRVEAIGTLAGGIAHDFNNILSSVIGYTELALDAVGGNTVLAGYLKEVYTAGHRAKNLIKQILTFARQSDKEIKPVQVSVIVEETLKFLRSSIPTTIEIRHNIESNSLIMGDSTQIHQILMNLCTNAFQAMEENGGVLNIGLTDVRLDADFTKQYEDFNPGDYLKLSVSDTGSGISPEIMSSIFEPYFTTKATGDGTGVGLATVNGIVKKYGGEIIVESEVEKGSTFSVYLPVTRKLTETKPYNGEAFPAGNKSILVVDDEVPVARMFCGLLKSLGYSVAMSTSSIEALALFRTKPNDFDLVITDMTMPNMTGDRLAIELMKIRPDIPVILCTGYNKKISDESASEMGIKAFVYKPIVKADLAKTVRKVLDEAKGKVQG